jgi:hypothetical protein
MGADLLRKSVRDAALSTKFFMYYPLPMYLVNLVRAVYEGIAQPLVLTVMQDQVTYMVMGRAISAAFGTATILLVYLLASRIAGRAAGLLAAFLLACSVLHLRDSHFFSVDTTLTFFSTLTWLYLLRLVQHGDARAQIGAGVSFGLALLSKYTAAFLVPVIVLAHILSPASPRTLRPLAGWVRVVGRTAATGLLGAGTFLLFDPQVIQYYDKFRADIRELITDPLTGVTKPEWIAHFADIEPNSYWFTNLLWWGYGPALEVAGLAGLVWLIARRDRPSAVIFAFPVAYWFLAGRSIAPFVRYAVPLAPALAVAAGAVCARGMASQRLRKTMMVATAVLVVTTGAWAAAYTNVYRSPDSRLTASQWLLENVPAGARILIEPSHNIPPTGSALTAVNFYVETVLWGPPRDRGERHDYYNLYTLDVYRFLYTAGPSVEDKRRYIESRLALADWIVMDDTFLQQYSHLPESEYGVVKQYYRDLLAGRLDFKLVQSFKVYPSIFGLTVNDDDAELTFRSFDHPRVMIFMRLS